MKVLNFKLNDINLYNEALKESQNPKYEDKLIQVFTSESNKEKIQEILTKLNNDFNCKIVGVTTAGEILNGKIYSDTIVSLSLFKYTSINMQYSKEINYNSGAELTKICCQKNTKALLLLSEGLKGQDYSGFIQGIEDHKKILIAGGLAGDNFNLKQTYVFDNNNIYDEGVLAVSFSSDNLHVTNKYNLNWTPIGPKFIVTDAEKNILKTINNEPAKEVFKKYLGEDIFKNPNSLLNFQLIYKEDCIDIARTPMKIDGDNIILAGPISNGKEFQFAFSNAANVSNGITTIGKELGDKQIEAIYIYSCIARKILLSNELLEVAEFSTLSNIAPVTGFFTYGEFFSGEKTNSLLNCTTTILALSESNHKVEYKLDNTNVTDINFSALTHFIQQTTDELDENKALLEQYKMIVDNRLIISKTDKNGIITYVNKEFCKISKYSREELIGHKHNIVKDPNVPNHIFKKMWDRILNGKTWQGTISNRAKDGTIYYVDTTIMPIKKDGEIIEFIALRFNITAKVHSKQRLLEKEKLMRALLDNQESIIVYISENKEIINTNKAFLETFNFKNIMEFKNRYSKFSDLFLENSSEEYIDNKKYPNWIDDVANKKFNFIPKVKIKIDKDIRIFRVRVAKINNKYIVNLDDITDLEKAIQKAYASEKAKSIFLANMSHEIRTPLNAIIGFISMLKTRNLDKQTNKYIGIIDRSSQTLLNIVNDILDFSKIETGKVSISPIKTECIPELRDSMLAFSFVCKQKHIKYNVYIDENIPNVLYCDIQRIKQVLNNLIGNAIKFTPENGQIDVEIKLKEIKNNIAKIHFSVKDSGIGIPEDKIKTIFKPFMQADNDTSRKFGGTGLGLAISQEYIKLMGSKIEIKSKTNEGSEFYFDLELPIVEQKIEHNETEESKRYNAKVLVAEDDPTNQLLISVLLKERGIKYKIANNGKEAVDMALKEDFDIVFMDITMPILDGLSAIKILREKEYKKPIISLSANVLEEDKKKFIQSGAVDTLNKPIVPKELDNILDKYIENSKKSMVSKVFNNFNNIKNNVKQTIKDTIHHTNKTEEFEYDDISIDKIAKELNIKDKNVILHLLKSFRVSIEKQMKAIEENGLNKDLLHTIKGLTGNLRLKNIYNLTSKFEQEIDNWDKSKYNNNTKAVYEHLKKILIEINNKVGGK